MQEDGRLCHLRLLQLIVSTFKHDVGNAVTQDFVSLFKQFFCFRVVVVQVLAHTHKLCPLSGEYKCFHYSFFWLNVDLRVQRYIKVGE